MKPKFVPTLIGLCLLPLAGCQQPAHEMPSRGADGRAQLFTGLGSHHRPVTTGSPAAQAFFDQGLVWCFAFNHDEAARCFREAARLDPACASAWWGLALCNGPHINNAMMSPTQTRDAWEAIQKARATAAGASTIERELIEALSKRYSPTHSADRAALDRAYADAMRRVWQAHRNDADIGVLFAESAMDLRPWKLWTIDGKPEPGTEEIVAVLEEVRRLDPDHPGANHLYIHAVEASPTPQRAMVAADRLRNAVPAAGHLVHMPSHVDVRTGRWDEAVEANVRASAADRAYREASPHQGFYRVYMSHNVHFIAYSAMMAGRSKQAIEAARQLVAGVPEEFARKEAAFVDPVMPTPIEVLMRFGRWDDVLAEPPPPDYLPISAAMRHFSRAVAFAAKKQATDAARAQSDFLAAAGRVPKEAVFGNNTAHEVLAVAEHMLAGELAYQRGSMDEAIAELREAVRIEDRLTYNEPPDWLQPVRHTLGAVLLDAGRPAEAEQVYRDDLRKLPNNGWSLHGLARSLKARGATAEAAEVEAQFRKAWAQADTQIGSSCLCVKHGA